MATVAHVIRSYYDPADYNRLERETGQPPRPLTDDDDRNIDPWQTESACSAQRRVRLAPRFVPASVDSGDGDGDVDEKEREKEEGSGRLTAEWYRSLRTRLTATSSESVRREGFTSASANASEEAELPRPRSAPAPQGHRHDPPLRAPKTNWFAPSPSPFTPNSNSNSNSSSSATPPPTTSVADILVRDPPPRAGEPRFEPPVWLHIGPSNRGFGMLERYGWKEGEGLGVGAGAGSGTSESRSREVDGNEAPPSREVIDLTLSDADSDSDADSNSNSDDDLQGSTSDPDTLPPSLAQAQAQTCRGSSPHAQRALLTPLPTVLKADRLGIGLKAKTHGIGPYKQPRKRVTHNAAALAAHVKAAEETRRKKMADGRGTRGFAKARRREEERRGAMLAYLHE